MQQTNRVRRRRKRKSSGWLHEDKRRPPSAWQARQNAAYADAARRYCDALGFWRYCLLRTCRRRQACSGDAPPCLERFVAGASEAEFAAARRKADAGGKRRVPATSGPEREFRRSDFFERLWRTAVKQVPPLKTWFPERGADPACAGDRENSKVT